MWGGGAYGLDKATWGAAIVCGVDGEGLCVAEGSMCCMCGRDAPV